MDRVGFEPTDSESAGRTNAQQPSNQRALITFARWEAGGFGMTIGQALHQILILFMVPVFSLLQITVVGTGAGEAGFIANEFQIQDIQGKRRA
jgi:hypothetical protein